MMRKWLVGLRARSEVSCTVVEEAETEQEAIEKALARDTRKINWESDRWADPYTVTVDETEEVTDDPTESTARYYLGRNG